MPFVWMYVCRGIALCAGRLYHTSDDGIIKPLSMRQLLQHWQQAQLHGHRTTSRSCVASALLHEKCMGKGIGKANYWARQRPWCRKWRFSRPLNEASAVGQAPGLDWDMIAPLWSRMESAGVYLAIFVHAFNRSRWWRAEACPCFAKACGAPAAKFASHWANTFSPYTFRESKNVIWNWLIFLVCSHMLRSHTRNHGAVMNALSCPVAKTTTIKVAPPQISLSPWACFQRFPFALATAIAGLFPTCVRNASGVVIKRHLRLGSKVIVADESVFHAVFLQVQVLNFTSVCSLDLAIACLTNQGYSKRSQLSRLAAKSQDTTATACSCVRNELVLKADWPCYPLSWFDVLAVWFVWHSFVLLVRFWSAMHQ